MFRSRETRNAQRNFNLSLCRRLRDRRMSDMADLAGAMGFVMRVTIEMGHNLNAEDEDRQNQRCGDQTEGESL